MGRSFFYLCRDDKQELEQRIDDYSASFEDLPSDIRISRFNGYLPCAKIFNYGELVAEISRLLYLFDNATDTDQGHLIEAVSVLSWVANDVHGYNYVYIDYS